MTNASRLLDGFEVPSTIFRISLDGFDLVGVLVNIRQSRSGRGQNLNVCVLARVTELFYLDVVDFVALLLENRNRRIEFLL